MEKLYFIIAILIFSYQKSFPQNYTEMLTNDSEWQLTSCNNGCLTDVLLLRFKLLLQFSVYKETHFIINK